MKKSHFTNFIFLSFLFILFTNTLYAKESAKKMIKHKPYANKECASCHVDKKGESGELKEDIPTLCYTCHDNYDNNNFIHGPVGAGGCMLCHDPHESENPKLLVYKTINELCTTCHTEKGEMLATVDNIHPPVKDSCINCHDPHAENNKFQLRGDRTQELCLMCHIEKKERISNSKNKHGAIEMGDKCLNCHDPHATGRPRMLKAETPKDLCLQCHSNEWNREEDGTTLMNMGEHLENNPDHHGPILWGDCAACHNPHGSDNLRMLKQPFPEKATQKFSPDGYICFKCHEPKKIEEKYTTEFTNFRKEEKNLHFIHVKDKSITCKACHDYHGSRNLPHHLREKSSFGSAKFSLHFLEKPTGGSCNPICHQRREYDRENPKVK
ncbi:hypothetical protein HUE87_10990 [Candidatus Sulfurimonas marisnigri]|uniref:Doubled CXXCH motif domain-containing protein n=1 Tax=Candidatus Sulfurimonas marisnigri TaxID=2740405 RepID=A0A7S7RQF2_9BACT|nr:cytochrome c3 family protein [Candidatus Sulfurimonas marisnigri]QOY54390.1 hypothetical protein HUE87_10990 [Candidatus Sulfurimonas marisnigri]